MGGISTAIVTYPGALGLGLTSGLGPVSGLITAIVLGFFAAIFGGSKTQISAPAVSMTVVISILVAQEIKISGSLDGAWPVLFLMFLFTGVFQLMLAVVKFGSVIRYIPFSVVSGFMSGTGIIVMLLQLDDLFGVYDGGFSSILDAIMHIDYYLEQTNYASLAIGTSTVFLIVLIQKVKKTLPAALIAMVLLSAITYCINLDIKLLGSVMTEPAFNYSNLNFMSIDNAAIYRIGVAAASLSVLGSLNSLLNSLLADRLTRTVHDSDRELFGQGIGNIMSALFGGIPGSGAAVCTVANINAGGHSRLSGVFNALALLLIFLFASGISAYIPNAVMAGLLIYIGYILVDFKAIKDVFKASKTDAIIMIVVLLLTVFWNMMFAVIIGLVLASLHFMKKMSDVVEFSTNQSKIDRIINQVIESFTDSQDFTEKVLVKSIKGPVFFGFSSRFLRSMRNISEGVKAVVFNLSEVPYMDHSGVKTFIEVVQFLNERGVNVCFTELSNKNYKLLYEAGLIPHMVNEDHVFDSVEECIMWLNVPGHLENDPKLKDQFYVYPAFTPNGDGINDYWVIRKAEDYPEINVEVFDLAGNRVYQSVGYQDPWDGTHKGKLLPSGEYKYVITNRDGLLKGSIYLFR